MPRHVGAVRASSAASVVPGCSQGQAGALLLVKVGAFDGGKAVERVGVNAFELPGWRGLQQVLVACNRGPGRLG